MDLRDLQTAIENIDVRSFEELVSEALADGIEPMEIMNALSKSLERVGERFESGEYFLAELIVAGELMQKAVTKLGFEARQETEVHPHHGIVLGTIEGDIHSIGKDIIKFLLLGEGFTIYDLGTDVPVSAFSEKAKETRAGIIGVSALLSTTVVKLKDLTEKLTATSVRPSVKVIMGGAATRNWMVAQYGVDAATNNAVKGLKIIKSWV